MNTRRIILIVVVVLLVVGVGNFAWNATQTRGQLAQVASKNAGSQDEGTRRLMARGVLFDALQGGAPPETRLAAIGALGRLANGGKNPAAFKELLQMLKDPDTESAEAKTHPVRDAAKDAVAAVGPEYADVLLDAAKDPDKNIQEQSRAALKKIGAPLQDKMASRLGDKALRAPLGDILAGIGPNTIALIAPYLQADKLPPADKADDLNAAKVQLIEIMGKFKTADAATPIIPFKDDADPNVRRTVVTALANIADPVGAPVLIAALQDPNTDATARAAAAGALGAIATPEANAAMTRALSDYDLSVASAAGAGLKRAGDKASGSIAQALSDPDPAVRALAADAGGGTRTTDLVVKALSDTNANVRANAALALGDILFRANAVHSALEKLAAASDDKEKIAALKLVQTRGGMMELLRSGAPANALPNALAALQSQADAQKDDEKKPFDTLAAKLSDPAVQATEKAITPLVEITPASLAPLIAALGDSDGTVSQNAATALSRLGTPAIAPLVMSLGSPNETVAYYASQALGGVGRTAVDAVLPVAQTGNPGARWAAITLGTLGDSRAVPALQTLSQSPDADTAEAARAALAKLAPAAAAAPAESTPKGAGA